MLIHGAWADGSSWARVTARLQRAGYTVEVPPNPLRGLASDAAYVASFLKTIKGPIVLVGHSYGGSVITGAATGNPEVKALVYVDAFIPDEGETVLQLSSAKPGTALSDPAKVFDFVPYPGAVGGDVDLYIKPSAFHAVLRRGREQARRRGPRRGAATAGGQRARGRVGRAGMEDDPVLGRDRDEGPRHPAGRAGRHGAPRSRQDHQGRGGASVHGLAAGRGHEGHSQGRGGDRLNTADRPRRRRPSGELDSGRALR